MAKGEGQGPFQYRRALVPVDISKQEDPHALWAEFVFDPYTHLCFWTQPITL